MYLYILIYKCKYTVSISTSTSRYTLICTYIYSYIYLYMYLYLYLCIYLWYLYLYLHKYTYIYLIMGRIPNLVMKRRYTGTKLPCFMIVRTWFLSSIFQPDLILHYPRPFRRYTNSQALHPCTKMSHTIDVKKVHESAGKCRQVMPPGTGQ